jgi:beta-glucanase (GH16 family)
MPKTLIFLLIWCVIAVCDAQQCAILTPSSSYHDPFSTPGCWGSAKWVGRHKHDNAYELCNRTANWTLMFEDNFDGNSIDRTKWQLPEDYHTYKPDETGLSVFNTYDSTREKNNYLVENGSLKILIKKEINPRLDTLFPHKFTSGQLVSWHHYPAGRYEVRCRIPYTREVNFAPLWLYAARNPSVQGQPYYQEVDIEMGLNHESTSVPTWTFHRRPPDNNGGNCMDGKHSQCSNGRNFADGAWHTMVIDWDPYRIMWFIDGQVFRTIYRTYGLGGVIHINECKGPGVGWWYVKNDMMPLFTNMNIMSCAAVAAGYTGGNQQMEIDYIRSWRNLDCNKVINLCEFRTSSENNGEPVVTPRYEDETPTVITGGIINVAGGDCRYNAIKRNCIWRQVHQDILATKVIYLNPGFTAVPFAGWGSEPPAYHDNFTARIVPCSYNKTWEEETENPESIYEQETGELRQVMNFDPGTQEFEADKAYLLIYPNPVKDFAHVDYVLPVDDEVGIVLADINGRIVQVIESGERAAAAYGLTVKTADLNPGVYFVQMATAGGYRESKRLVVVR